MYWGCTRDQDHGRYSLVLMPLIFHEACQRAEELETLVRVFCCDDSLRAFSG